MNAVDLNRYLIEIENYIEYSFYKDSSSIMRSISKNGLDNVLDIMSVREVKKGVYDCITTWSLDDNNCITKTVTIDASGEIVYITEVILDNKNVPENVDKVSDIDIEKEYSEILSLLRKKHLNSIEKNILYKVVKSFFE